MKQTLASVLWQFCNDLFQVIKDHKASGALLKTKEVYSKRNIEDFNYDKGAVVSRYSYVDIEREEWHWKDKFDFINHAVKQMPSFIDSRQQIMNEYSVSEGQADFWLTRFVQINVNKMVEDDVTDEFFVNQTSLFISDLSGASVEWTANILLVGVWLGKKNYEVTEKIALRQTEASDFEQVNSGLFFQTDDFLMSKAPSAVLTISARAISSNEIQKEIHSVLDIFRLFRLGSVQYSRYTLSPKSILQMGHSAGPALSNSTSYKYGITESEINSFRSFFEKMKLELSENSLDDYTITQTTPLGVSYQRYKDATLSLTINESTITSAITCLEALFLKPKERSELSHRLSQRVAALLRVLGFDAVKVYNEISRAYEIRSAFIHGAPLESGQSMASDKLTEAILEYARISLVIFLRLSPETEKTSLINKLDNSLLNEKSLNQIIDLVSNDAVIKSAVPS